MQRSSLPKQPCLYKASGAAEYVHDRKDSCEDLAPVAASHAQYVMYVMKRVFAEPYNSDV